MKHLIQPSIQQTGHKFLHIERRKNRKEQCLVSGVFCHMNIEWSSSKHQALSNIAVRESRPFTTAHWLAFLHRATLKSVAASIFIDSPLVLNPSLPWQGRYNANGPGVPGPGQYFADWKSAAYLSRYTHWHSAACNKCRACYVLLEVVQSPLCAGQATWMQTGAAQWVPGHQCVLSQQSYIACHITVI